MCLLCLLASGGSLPSSEQLTADFCQQPSNQGVCWKGADHILWDLCWCALTRAASLLLPLLTGFQNLHSKQETGESSFLGNLSMLFCAGALVSLLALSLQDGREGMAPQKCPQLGPGCKEGVTAGTDVGQGLSPFRWRLDRMNVNVDIDRMKPVVQIPVYLCVLAATVHVQVLGGTI